MMKFRRAMFKRQGKQWLPSFLAHSPDKANVYLADWADEKNFPTQLEISEVLAKVENILLRVEDMEVSDLTRDFAEALTLLLSAFKAFMEYHNADNALRDLIISCARMTMLFADPLALEDSFQKLRDDAEVDAKAIFSTADRSEKKGNPPKKQASAEAASHTADTQGRILQGAAGRRPRRSVRDATLRLRRRLAEKISGDKGAKRSVWALLNDPELKSMYEEIASIFRHLADGTISGSIVSGTYATEPLKALRNKRSSVYGGISSALESALKRPQASTLKRVAMAALEIPADMIIGTGCGIHAGYIESKDRILYIRELLNNYKPDRHSDDEQSEEDPTPSIRLNVPLSSFRTLLRRVKSLSDADSKLLPGYAADNIVSLCKRVPMKVFSGKKVDSKIDDGAAPDNQDNEVLEIRFKRSLSLNDAKSGNNRKSSNSSQRFLDEWFMKDPPVDKELGQNAPDCKNGSVHSCDDEWSIKDSIMRLKSIGARTRVISSAKSNLLRMGHTEYLKGNAKDLLNPSMREKVRNIIKSADNRGCNVIFATMAHLFSAYAQRADLREERKKFIGHLKKVLQTLTTQENIDLLIGDINNLSKLSSFTTLMLLLSIRKDNRHSATPAEKDPIGDAPVPHGGGSEGSDTHTNEQPASSRYDPSAVHHVPGYLERLASCIIEIIESPEGRNVIADTLDLYVSIKLERNRRRLTKAIKLFKLTHENYSGMMPGYTIIFQIVKDITSKVIPFFAEESKMLSIPIHRATVVRGFELYFLEEPKISLHDIIPDRFGIKLEHRTTNIDKIQKLVRLENGKYAFVPDSLRRFVKFFLKISPTSVHRFQKWDIEEGEFGPKWLVNITLKGIYFVLDSEDVALIATNRHKGTLGNFTYNVMDSFNKIGLGKKKSVKGAKNGKLGQLLSASGDGNLLLKGDGNAKEEGVVYMFGEKESYIVWKGKVNGMVYGKGIRVDLIFETIPPNEDDLSKANIVVRNLHRKLSHSKAIRKRNMTKLRRPGHPGPCKNANDQKRNTENDANHICILKKYIPSSLFHISPTGETFRLAGISVNVPYYSSRLRIKGFMGSMLSLSAEKKIRALIRESIENYIIKSLALLDFEKAENFV